MKNPNFSKKKERKKKREKKRKRLSQKKKGGLKYIKKKKIGFVTINFSNILPCLEIRKKKSFIS